MICLLGYMGSGKSTIGRKVAELLDLDFIDLDENIELEFGKSITQIFNQYGEYFFRKLERKYLIKNLRKTNILLSVGGGTPCFYDNIDAINKYADSIYIKVNSLELKNRLIKDMEHRPIIKGKSESELLSFISSQLETRQGYYTKAKYTISNMDIHKTINEIIELKL